MIKKINWGTAIIIFFGIFLSFAAAFITFAMRQTNDLVANDYYEQGANFSKTIEIKQRSLPFKDSISLSQNNTLIFCNISNSIAQNADSISLQFYCGSNKRNDLTYRTKSVKNSAFNRIKNETSLTFPVSDFTKSYYSVTINWWIKNIQFQTEKNIQIK